MAQLATEIFNTMLHPAVKTAAERMFRDMEKELESYVQGTNGYSCPLKTKSVLNLDVDIIKRAESYAIYADLPGFVKNDVNLYVTKDKILKITAERKEHTEEHDSVSTYIRKSRRYGSYNFDVSLPDDADMSSLYATMKEGVLQINVKRVVRDEYSDMQRVHIN